MCTGDMTIALTAVLPRCFRRVVFLYFGVQAGAVFFKNLVKQHWAPDDETAFTIPEEVKAQAKYIMFCCHAESK